jgi:heat shock protein HslJ
MHSLPGEDGNSVNVDDPDKYILRLNPNATVDVTSDCNTGYGVYSLASDNRISIDLTGGTTKDCGEGSYSDLFFERLERAGTYELGGNDMNLLLEGGGIMEFSR